MSARGATTPGGSDFYGALEALRSEAGSLVDLGRDFERLMRRAFEAHPYEYGPARFEQVWLWGDWPEREELGYGHDIGIDLVARETEAYGGGLCAIQCKNFAADHQVPTSQVDSFLAASGTAEFASRILVVTSSLSTNCWTKVERASSPRCEVLDAIRLSSWPLRWLDFLDAPDELEFDHRERHRPRPEQRDALDAIAKGYQSHSRGRLVMPCGTGKSLVAMWAAEETAGKHGTVLYLVPSIALMGQTMREWARHRNIGHTYLGVCSDKTTGRRSDDDGDTARDLAELAMPVSTDRDQIALALARPAGNRMRVVFSTYQSLPVLSEALPADFTFDLVICDEAHRTTGVDQPSADETSAFRLIHDEQRVPAQFRLFMTATQRIYTAAAKARAATKDSDVYSMDDEQLYGPLLYEMSFSDAVDRGLLSDYEVLIVAHSESQLTAGMSNRLAAINSAGGRRQIVTKEDAVKLLGCWDALADPNTTGVSPDRVAGQMAAEVTAGGGKGHLRTAIAFTNTVKLSKAIAGPSSETSGLWQYVAAEAPPPATGGVGTTKLLELSVRHVDGSTPAIARAAQLDRLRGEPEPGVCRVISNARVLTEGVDVPALDAILFLQPRKSKIDIVQAVGRVMRTSPGKEKGYIVIPVVVPEGRAVNDVDVLEGSDFAVVWDVVRALRAHDERMDIDVNHLDAARNSERISLLDRSSDHPIDDLFDDVEQLRFLLDERIASKLVDRCGDRQMWPSWGEKAARVCEQVRKRVDAELARPETDAAFNAFVQAMRSVVGDHLTEDQAAEMIAQHAVTIPIFDCLFADSQFAESNPVSIAMTTLLESFAASAGTDAEHLFEEELRPLRRAYRSMESVFAGALTPAAKVDVLREIYEGFFRAAMRDTVKRLGIVYTPVEIVDFIIRSADAVCRKEFGVGLTDESVNILDPFTGTGTFIYRLLTLQDADGNFVIRDRDLHRKYGSELFANEVVLLAYYIAAIKIEAGMAERHGFDKDAYAPFPGITFSDTFLTSERSGPSRLPGFADNIARQSRLGEVPITVIMMNPPWSAGQKSSGDDNPGIDYPHIEQRVRETYGARHREVTGRGAGGNSSGNLYVQAIRWASDRLNVPRDDHPKPGLIALVHPNSLSNGTSLAGMRAALRDEFTDIYVVNLLGDAMKSGEEFRREGDKIFGAGSRNGVQITLLARNPEKDLDKPAQLHYATVPERAKLVQKFDWLSSLSDVISDQFEHVPVTPRHDWVNLTDGTFKDMVQVCTTSHGRSDNLLLGVNASGVKTNCDTYVYSFDYRDLIKKVSALIDAYDAALARVMTVSKSSVQKQVIEQVTKNTDLGTIKWTDTLKQSLRRGEVIEFDESRIREVLYRPFVKVWLYEDARILSSVKAVSALFAATPPPPADGMERTTARGSAWQAPTVGPSLEPSPRTSLPTSAPPERTSPHGSSREHGDHDDRPLEHGGVRSAGRGSAPGPSSSGSGPADEGHSSHQAMRSAMLSGTRINVAADAGDRSSQAPTPPPGGQRSSSQTSPSRSRSGSSPPTPSTTSASPAGKRGEHPGSDHDHRHVEHDLSRAGDSPDAGPGSDQGIPTDAGDASHQAMRSDTLSDAQVNAAAYAGDAPQQAAPPPPEVVRSRYPHPPTPASSRCWQPTECAISRQRVSQQPVGSSQRGDPREHSLEPNGLRAARYGSNLRPARPGSGRTAHPAEAILVKSPAPVGTPDAVLAAGLMQDLNGLSPGIGGCRAVPRRRPST